MRLKNIYRILQDVLPVLKAIKIERISTSSDYRIAEWDYVLEALGKLKSVNIFDEEVSKIFHLSPIFGNRGSHLDISASQYSSVNPILKNLTQQATLIISLCDSLGYKMTEGGFEVKLPDTNDFNEFARNTEDFNQLLKIFPFTYSEGGKVELSKTDIGSTWLEFIYIGAEVVFFLTSLGLLAQAALKIKSMYLSCEQQKEAVRGARTKNDLSEKITELYDEMIDAAASKEAENIKDQLERNLTPEDTEKTEQAIKKLGVLMSKGLEIYASLDAPPEAKDVFPSIDTQKMLPFPQKYLSEHSEK